MAARLPARLLLAVLVLLAAVAAPPASAQTERVPTERIRTERILSFAADVTVRPDGVLRVEETIEVMAAGEEIRRGIFRDFPTRSLTDWGLNHIVGFEIRGIERDGRPEPYFLAPLEAGVRIYVGREDVLLPHGRHRYTITYETTRQLFQWPGEDELYWNVTGDAWAFPIDRATVTVRLPDGAGAATVLGYTGGAGEQGHDVTEAVRDGDGALRLGTARPLAPGEGFTIDVRWPEGAVERPDDAAAMLALMTDNRGPLIGAALVTVLLVYYGLTWRRVGRDPRSDTIIPLFSAPDGMSPAATGYLWNRGFGGPFSTARALTVTITGLATRRALAIDELAKSRFLLRRAETGQPAGSPDEQAVMAALFPGDATDVSFGGAFEPRMEAAQAALGMAVARDWGDAYFRTNRGPWFLGALIGLAAAAASLMIGAMGEDAITLVAVLAVFAVAFGVPAAVMLGNALARWTGGAGQLDLGPVLSLVIAVACGLPTAVAMLLIAGMVAPAALIPAFLPVPICLVFWHLLPAPTPLGRRTLDAIEGYRRYLSIAEADRLNAAGREPAVTEALFETHLPYAMALGVEEQWTAKVMARMAAGDGARRVRNDYEPAWYHARRDRRISPETLAGSLSRNLGGAAVHAVTRPGSSSSGGSSSSRSSGGGGGGGGGGGW